MTGLRRKYFRGLRPVVLVVGLIAPAVLASGMLMAEITGFEATARGATAGSIQAAGKVKPPLHPQTGDVARDGEAYDSRQGSIENIGLATGHPHGRMAAGPEDRHSDNAKGLPNTQPVANTETQGEAGVLADGPHAARPGAADAAVPPAAAPPAAAPDGAAPPVAAPPEAAPANAAGAAGSAPSNAAKTAGAVPGRQVMEPTAVPPPSGPSRVYGQLIIIRKPEPTPQPVADKARPASAPQAPPAQKKEQEELTCALDWRDTWLWDLCKERGGQS